MLFLFLPSPNPQGGHGRPKTEIAVQFLRRSGHMLQLEQRESIQDAFHPKKNEALKDGRSPFENGISPPFGVLDRAVVPNCATFKLFHFVPGGDPCVDIPSKQPQQERGSITQRHPNGPLQATCCSVPQFFCFFVKWSRKFGKPPSKASERVPWCLGSQSFLADGSSVQVSPLFPGGFRLQQQRQRRLYVNLLVTSTSRC